MIRAHLAFLLAVLTVLNLILTARAATPADYQISAAKGPYFLCDTRVTEDRWLVERFIHPLHRSSERPLLEKKYDWEGSGPHAGGSVLFDPQSRKYLMWYSVFNATEYQKRLPFSYNVCYAESNDGLTWDRPILGLLEFHGSKQNNCIRMGTDKTQNVDVCLNPDPKRWPGKFLAIHNQKGGVFVTWSDDGKTFTRLTETPAIPYHSDTHNNFVYDEVRDRWLLYCRNRAYAGYHKRRVSLQTSADLKAWSHEKTILIPTETEIPEYYGMTVFRRGDLFLGMVQVYETKSGLMHGELAWSGDGEHWDFLPSHPRFLTLGPPGSFDAGMVLPFESPVLVDDQMRFYYGGFSQNHNAQHGENHGVIALMTAERDRLLGVRPNSDQPGVLMTRPFPINGRQLTVNAVVKGKITAELRTDGNKPITGFTFADSRPITATGFQQPVTWNSGSLDKCTEREVRVVFKLENSELYTFDLPQAKP